MKTTVRQQILKAWLTGFSLLILAGTSVSGQEQYSFNRKTVNWGFKIGLNANAIMRLRGMQGEEELMNVSFRNKSGCDITGFFRVNLDRFFMQPEIGWSVLNKDILFSFPSNESYSQSNELSFHSRIVNANGLIGYNITKSGPFVFNVFTGTSLHYQYDTHFSLLYPKSEHRSMTPVYNAYGVVGFSMNISNVHFDIRYAISVFPSNLDFNTIADKPERLEGVSLQKSENILSFSCGVMF
ncbi:MAG: PorT family protein [Dysgonamonadaceae bacterium]|jgi:hypothetical protein|nr:PorT family protein [Dysgonamonadaceae bacterium]